MKKATYIRCPRCELNYILKKDKICSVCKQEMQVGGGAFDELDLELCPICKTNYIQPDEVMCATCLSERANDSTLDLRDDDWNNYINRDDAEDLGDSQEDEIGDMSSVKGLDDDDDDDIVEDDDFDDLGTLEEMESEDESVESFEEDEDDDLDFDNDDDFDDDDDDDFEDDDD